MNLQYETSVRDFYRRLQYEVALQLDGSMKQSLQ